MVQKWRTLGHQNQPVTTQSLHNEHELTYMQRLNDPLNMNDPLNEPLNIAQISVVCATCETTHKIVPLIDLSY